MTHQVFREDVDETTLKPEWANRPRIGDTIRMPDAPHLGHAVVIATFYRNGEGVSPVRDRQAGVVVIMGTGDEWSWCVGGCADGPDTACAPCAREHRWRAEFTRVQNALTVLENQWREATAREHKLRLAAERDRDEWKGLAQTLRVQESHMMGAVSDSGVPSGSELVGLADATREVTRQRDEARICADTAEARVRELETRDRDRQERYENWLTELHDPLTAVAEAAQAYRKTSQRMYWCRLCDALDALAATGVIVTDSPPLYVLEKPLEVE